MGLEAPVRGAVHAGGGESGEAKLVLAGGDIFRNSLERFKVGNVFHRVAGLLKQGFVHDDAIGFNDVSDAVNGVAFLKREVLGRKLAVNRGAGKVIAVILPVCKADGAVHLEQGGRFLLGHLGHQGLLIRALRSGDNSHRNAGRLRIEFCKILPLLILLGFEVEVIHGASRCGNFRILRFGRRFRRRGGFSRLGRGSRLGTFVGIAANTCDQHHGRKQKCQCLFHNRFPFIFH